MKHSIAREGKYLFNILLSLVLSFLFVPCSLVENLIPFPQGS